MSMSELPRSLGPPQVSDKTRGPTLLVIVWILGAITLILFGLRMYTRSRITHNLGLDDAILVVALV